MKTTVLLVDDHSIVREGLRALIESQGDIAIIGEASDGSEAAQMAKRRGPDVLMLDLLMPQLNGVEATRQILKQNPRAKVLILSSSANAAHVKQVIEAGATG